MGKRRDKRKSTGPADVTPGFRFGFDHGGSVTLAAAAAPIERASPVVAAQRRLVVRADVYGQAAGDVGIVGWQFAASAYSHYLFGSYVDAADLAELSRRLEAVVACYT